MAEFLLNTSFNIFGLTITYYALCLMSGILAGAGVAYYMFKRRGINPDYILDVLIAIIPCSVICARLWYVVFDLDEFIVNGVPDFGLMIDIRNGGISIIGGIAGGALGLLIVSLIHKEVPFIKFADVGALVLPLGQAIGRWGNFINQEVYGHPTDITWFPFSVYIEKTGQYHLALFFYEMVLNLIVFAILFTFLYFYKGKRNGYALGAYLFAYGLIRAAMEPLRDKEFNMGDEILGLPGMTWVSILMMLFGLGIVIFLLVRDIKEKNYWWKGFFKKQPIPQTAGVAQTDENTPKTIEVKENSENTQEAIEVTENTENSEITKTEEASNNAEDN